MKSQSPALTQSSLVATAGRKAHKVQRKLLQAEAELHTANKIFVKAKAKPVRDAKAIEAAVEQNVAAEEKVRDAAQELHVVKELLAEAGGDPNEGAKRTKGGGGQSGDGVKSLIRHLERDRSGASD